MPDVSQSSMFAREHFRNALALHADGESPYGKMGGRPISPEADMFYPIGSDSYCVGDWSSWIIT